MRDTKGRFIKGTSEFLGIKRPSVTGKNNPFYGKTHSEESRKRISEVHKGKFGELSPRWKGGEVGYRGLHVWVERWRGKPNKCEDCGKIGQGHTMHWSNISGSYKRELDDWRRRCPKCHAEYDKNKRKQYA